MGRYGRPTTGDPQQIDPTGTWVQEASAPHLRRPGLDVKSHFALGDVDAALGLGHQAEGRERRSRLRPHHQRPG
ncbi:hypothetical protein GCM10010343_67020 [Streptomyces avidinii]|nr:hypothetical protein GCM10010343_67020 [Streptomyces avidinii]